MSLEHWKSIWLVATTTHHHLLLITFPLLLFLLRHPFTCLRRRWWDGVKENIQRGRVNGKLANPGSLGSMAVEPIEIIVNYGYINNFSHNILQLFTAENDIRKN